MNTSFRSKFPLVALLLIPMLLLIGFLLNHIIMFVDFFTIKNTVITILLIYAIICNWHVINLHFRLKDLDNENNELVNEAETQRSLKWDLEREIEKLKKQQKHDGSGEN